MVDDVILHLLSDEDGRVRNAAATALVLMVPKLFFPVDTPLHDPAIAKAEVCIYIARFILNTKSRSIGPGLIGPNIVIGIIVIFKDTSEWTRVGHIVSSKRVIVRFKNVVIIKIQR